MNSLGKTSPFAVVKKWSTKGPRLEATQERKGGEERSNPFPGMAGTKKKEIYHL